MIAAELTEQILGPLGALVAVLVVLGLFLRGSILSRSTVPREDYDTLMEINASYAEALPLLTQAVHEAMALAREERQKSEGA